MSVEQVCFSEDLGKQIYTDCQVVDDQNSAFHESHAYAVFRRLLALRHCFQNRDHFIVKDLEYHRKELQYILSLTQYEAYYIHHHAS